MGTLIFVCPTPGLEVFTGLEMDQFTFADLPSVLPDIRCPHCPKPHQLCEVDARLFEGVRRTEEERVGFEPTMRITAQRLSSSKILMLARAVK